MYAIRCDALCRWYDRRAPWYMHSRPRRSVGVKATGTLCAAIGSGLLVARTVLVERLVQQGAPGAAAVFRREVAEDGAHHVHAELMQGFADVVFTIGTSGVVYTASSQPVFDLTGIVDGVAGRRSPSRARTRAAALRLAESSGDLHRGVQPRPHAVCIHRFGERAMDRRQPTVRDGAGRSPHRRVDRLGPRA